MSKPRKSTQQPTPSSGTAPTASDIAKLGDEYLQASKMRNDGFKSAPKWPIYQTAFQALENFLKAYLLLKGATMEHGHGSRAALNAARAKGLVLKVAPAVEDAVMKASEHYPDGGSGVMGAGADSLGDYFC
jgi:hypothetical protein